MLMRSSEPDAIFCNSVASEGLRHVASTAFSGSWARALTKPRPIPLEAPVISQTGIEKAGGEIMRVTGGDYGWFKPGMVIMMADLIFQESKLLLSLACDIPAR